MMAGRNWHGEADVIIVGYGLAGAVAAIEAHDSGAEALILEKSQYPGGCSILSQGVMLCARDAEKAIQYLTKTSGDRVSQSLIHSFAQDLIDNREYLTYLAQACNATVKTVEAYAPRGMVDADYTPGGYPFPGYDTFYRILVTHVPGFNGFPWVQKLGAAGAKLMKMAMNNAEKRPIRIMLSTPARRLITDAKGAVIGVMAEQEGKEISLRARHAVILACGGFEHNKWLIKQFMQGTPFYSMAPLTHTGDGVIMAQKVGAALWHMWHIHGSYGFKFDEFPIAFRTPLSGIRSPKRVVPWIVVDKLGRRYMNEYPPAPQDTGHRAMELFDPDIPGYPRIPSYLILDEVGRKRGPIAQPLAIGEHRYDWSRDNLQEVAKGWILKDDDIQGLALRIKETGENEGKMDAETLETTIAQWNETVRRGKDPLRRPPGTMMPIEVPPFYATPVYPIITNTQGGPQHNERQQAVDAFGDPIPGLYTAGELGSFWSHIYLPDGNLSECISSGRKAGRNAAAEPPRSD